MTYWQKTGIVLAVVTLLALAPVVFLALTAAGDTSYTERLAHGEIVAP
jgi:hypothetical protein